MKRYVLTWSFLWALGLNAQELALTPAIQSGVICQFTYNYNIAGGNLAQRYTNGSAVGAGAYYKTKKNWFFGAEMGHWFGANIREFGIFDAITDPSGYALDNNGSSIPVSAQQRGWVYAGKVGKIIPLGRKNQNSGIMISAGVGYMEHYIRLANNTRNIAALQGDFRYGYDRLTGGIMLNQFIGYQNLDKKKRINFFIGVEFAQGFTSSYRVIDYDKRQGNTESRKDNYTGIRFGWLLPIYTSAPDEGSGYRFK